MQLTHAWLSDFTDATLSPPLPPLPMSLTSTALFITFMYMQVYGPNNKADIQNQQDLQAAFDDIFFQYQVDMTW